MPSEAVVKFGRVGVWVDGSGGWVLVVCLLGVVNGH